MIRRIALGLVLLGLLAQINHLCAQPKTIVAGRTLPGWAKDLKSDNEIVRLRAVKTLGAFEAEATVVLIAALDDKSAGVQYWAAYHLGRIGKSAKAAVPKLMKLKTSKDSPAVSMAAAFALCRIDKVEGRLNVLLERLKSSERGMACSAAELLGMIGPPAKSSVSALEQAFKKSGDYHVRGAAQNALRKIQPGWTAN